MSRKEDEESESFSSSSIDNNNNNNSDNNNNNSNSHSIFNPIGHIQNAFSNIDLNPLNVDFKGHTDKVVNFFQHGTGDLNERMQGVVSKLRSNEYRKKMHSVLTKIKDTKEYKSTSNTDYDVIFESVDMYSNLQQDPTMDKDEIDVVTDLSSYKKKFAHWLAKERISTLLFIPILGILVALMGIFCDFLLMELGSLRDFVTSRHNSNVVPTDGTNSSTNTMADKYDLIEGIVFVGYSVFFALISVCCISFISPYAVGSGIPEMKSIMSGINLSRVLGFKTLVSKIVGMVSASAAGLTIGRTGPFMHASAIIAQMLMGLKVFNAIKKNQIVRYQMLICALTSGVVANFGAPIGGLLFAIEVTATTAVMGNLWKGFLCATTTAIIFFLSRSTFSKGNFHSVYEFEFVPKEYGVADLITFVGIGIITGLIGAFFVFIYEKLVRFRLRYPILKQSRIILVLVISLISAIITYSAGPLCRVSLPTAMKQFLGKNEPKPFLFEQDQTPYYKYLNLLVFIVVKLVLTAFNIVLPVPGGAITPFIVTGAALGRLFGEILKDYFDSQAIEPAGFAAIASAGLVSGTIRNISPSIFVLELTGQLSLLVPILICSITSTAVGNFFNRPLFDTALKIQGLPFLSNYRSSKVYTMTAKQVMKKNINFLSMTSTVMEMKKFLDTFNYTFIPIVDSKENMLLVGIVERTSMIYMLDLHIENMEQKIDEFKLKYLVNNNINNNNSNNGEILEIDKYNNVGAILNTNNNNNNNNSFSDEEDDKKDNDKVSLIKSNQDENSSGSSDFEEILNTQNTNINKNDNEDLIKEIEDENSSFCDKPEIEHDDNDDDDNDDNDGIPLVSIKDQPILRNRHSTATTSNTEISPNNENIYVNDAFEISINDLKNGGQSVWGKHILGDIIHSGETALLMDLAPSQVPDLTPLNKVFHLFTMLGLGFTYVTSLGKLVGVITKNSLMEQDL
ncbi:hypothetical protein RB653_000272 [Dictyostelium firmibasis]|uniref:Chloride channel protein n=1 Tax=Dictyostelium firmibasis TaxID=79012 RepID=A0AAN7U206_9MYCE